MNISPDVDTIIIPQPEIINSVNVEEKPAKVTRQCPICHVHYTYGNSYWQHVRYVHAKSLSQCVICEKSYKRTTMAKHHILQSHKIAWHLCGNYVRKIKKNDLPENREVRSENENRMRNVRYYKKKTLHLISRFNCYNCIGSFATIEELFSHVKTHSGEKSNFLEYMEEDEYEEERSCNEPLDVSSNSNNDTTNTDIEKNCSIVSDPNENESLNQLECVSNNTMDETKECFDKAFLNESVNSLDNLTESKTFQDNNYVTVSKDSSCSENVTPNEDYNVSDSIPQNESVDINESINDEMNDNTIQSNDLIENTTHSRMSCSVEYNTTLEQDGNNFSYNESLKENTSPEADMKNSDDSVPNKDNFQEFSSDKSIINSENNISNDSNMNVDHTFSNDADNSLNSYVPNENETVISNHMMNKEIVSDYSNNTENIDNDYSNNTENIDNEKNIDDKNDSNGIVSADQM